MEGIKRADAVIVLMPGGYGTHVEIGAAIALGKPILIHATDKLILDTPYPCIFHYHPLVKLVISPTLDVQSIIDHVSSLRVEW